MEIYPIGVIITEVSISERKYRFFACSGPESKRGLIVLLELTKAMCDLKTSSLTSQIEQ